MKTGPNYQRKVYSEVVASIVVTTTSHDDARRLSNIFLARRGIEPVGSTRYSGKNNENLHLKVKYRVHGGWRSDFVRKLEYDALDAHVKLINVELEISRADIPAECPRQECVPCTVALNPSFRPPTKQSREATLSNEESPEKDRPGRWAWLRR